MVKRLLFFTIVLLFIQISEVFSQITIGTVDAGPYTPGSSIAATFTIGSTCIRPGNRFDLFLVRPDGTEITPAIGSYNGFYSTFVNGTIPAGTPAGIGYKLRIKSTTPVLTSNDSSPFDIQTGTPVLASVSSFPELALDAAGRAEVFGYCPGRDNIEFNFTNTSTAGSIVTGTVRNELTNAFETPLTFNAGPPDPSFIARLGHYTTFITSRLNGTVGTRAYLIVNNNINNSFGTTGSNIVCLPGGFLQYSVDLSDLGIKNNFPGTTYEIKWGDGNGATEVLTICDLAAGYVRHEYTLLSCGQPVYNTGNGNQYNVFGINISAVSPFCPSAGASLSTFVRVVTKPENRFDSPIAACTGSIVNFINTSIAGQTDANTPACTDNNVRYNWFVDNVRVAVNQPITYILSHRFTTPGVHSVRLESVVTGQCNGAPIIHEICIQDPPQPAFDFNNVTQRGCAPFTIQAFDRSVIDARCNTDNSYRWIVNGPAAVQFDPTAKDPMFTFNAPGTYEIILEIQTASCGVVRTLMPQKIIADGPPTAIMSPNVTLCTLNTLNFNTLNGPTKTEFTGTQVDLPDTYTWSVAAADGSALDPVNDYSFVNGTNRNTREPSIQFKKFIVYKISVIHKNSCTSVGTSQLITFSSAPEPKIDPVPKICYNTPASLNATVSGGTYQDLVWTTTGDGTFSSTNTLTTIYTPGPTDRSLLKARVTLTLNTGINGACKFIPVSTDIDIYPNNTGINTEQTICTGSAATRVLTSSVPGSTFTWTATNPDGNASGFTSPGSGNINEVITNSSLTQNAVIVYTITPSGNGCTGVSFTYTVTVTPKPVISTPNLEKTICHSSSAAIAVTSNIPTQFIWTSVASPGITGNTNPTSLSAASNTITINDVLLNSTFSQGTVTYTIKPYSAFSTGCEGNTITVVVKVDPVVTQANAGPDASICATNTYDLKGNKPDVGAGLWRLVSTHLATPVIAVPTDFETKVSGLVAGQSYTFEWAITGTGACAKSEAQVTITVNMPTIPGTATGQQTVCQTLNTGVITLSGNSGSVLGWQSLPDGQAIWADIPGTNTDLTYTFNNLTNTTQFRAVVQNTGCTIEYSSPATITVAPANTVADAGTDQILCNETSVALKGNPAAPAETGTWTMVSGDANAEITPGINSEAVVTRLTPGITYIFRWTITGNAPCGPTFDDVTVRNNPSIVQNIRSTSAVACNGQEVTLNGSVPTGGDGTNYTYSWEIKIDAGPWIHPPSDAEGEDLVITLTTPGTVSFRRTVISGGCTSTSNEYSIVVQPAITGNNITADQTICSGSTPVALTGPAPTGGGGTFTYQWQSSPDGTGWTNIGGANDIDYQPTVLTITTFYRRNASTLACGTLQVPSNAVKITVNPNAKAEFTWANDNGCVPFSLPVTVVPHADRNSTYTWYANTTVIGTGTTFPVYTIQNSNESVTIRLEVTSSLGCSQDEFSHVFSTSKAVPASFTQSTDEGCGPLAINFVNTSDLTTGATFLWDFGNGTTSPQANPGTVTYEAEATGKDTTYVITLTATTSCGSNSVTSTVLVKAKPIAIFSPSRTDGCSPMLVNFTNTSPGSAGTTYFYDFGDGSPVIQRTDKSPVQHTYNTTATTIFRATLTTVNECGTDVRSYNIRVAPQNITPELVVDADEKEGCAPHTVNFDNNSIGASRFTFDFGDGSPIQTTLTTGRVPHEYTTPGTFTITMTAHNSCSDISTTETVTVLAQPLTDFDALTKLGCPGLAVKFTNNTQNGVSYVWDFGDGSPTSNESEPTHIYTGTQEHYTVSLTAINNLGCPMQVTKTDFIHIVQPPVAAFNVSPSTLISIPDYSFSFQDESTNTPTIWEWDFGDGTGSALRNPSHTYLDTGTYKVTLKVINQQGCFTSTFKNVTIKGVPGYLFVPNSFIPGDTRPELREFRAKGSGIATWRFGVFNKWGLLLWETTKLEEGRPAESWDGTFKGQPMPQGVYFWKIDVRLVNGSEWKGMTYDKSVPKRTGPIHLIR
jgi:PKD repeat protein